MPELSDAGMFLAARWGMGFVGTAIATYMTWKTAQIRSTQSATGILYITMIFVLFGELTSMILAGRAGVIMLSAAARCHRARSTCSCIGQGRFTEISPGGVYLRRGDRLQSRRGPARHDTGHCAVFQMYRCGESATWS